MTFYRKIFLSLIVIFAFTTVNAKIAVWDILPKYEKLSRYHKDIYAFQQKGKWGLIKSSEKEILSASCDFITPFTNGYALAGIKESNNYLLEFIIEEDGSVFTMPDKYYLPSNYQYVSEGKLAIVNKTGKYGYITPDGHIIIKCQFDNALPFKEGLAPVKQGNYMKFINENYDRNPSRGILIVDFHYGDMTAAGCFSNGLAPVAYNTDYALINSSGKKVRKIKEADFIQTYKSNNAAPSNESVNFATSSSYSEYHENGKTGLKQGDHLIAPAQFDSFGEIYADGDIITTLNGKKGLLRIYDGDISITPKVRGIQTSELEVDSKGNIQPIIFDCIIPEFINDYKIFIDDGRGNLIEETSNILRNEDICSVTVSPSFTKGADQSKTRVVIEKDGLVLTDNIQYFSLIYPVKLRIVTSKPFEVWADEKDKATATVSATIYNDSNKSVTVTANWSNGKRESLTIPAHGSKKSIISVTQSNIQTKTTKSFTLTLSSGEKSTTTVTFNPFW